jgi:hypothetical protein
LEIFDFIADNTNVRSQTLRDYYGFSVKQFYSRIVKLLEYGLVRRKLGVYTLSSFGSVVYQNKLKMDAAIKEYHSLKAVDSIIATDELSPDVREQLINKIVSDHDVKTALLMVT